MASYTFDLALVKYYRESLNEYATFMPFKIANTKDQAFYAKISIINQGNLLWYFDDGAGNLVTEKTYTINANSVLSLNEKLVASTTPTETQKDQVTILVEYFKDDTLLNKFGEDTITVPIHIFIQNADYSWTSTQYPNESDIVFDKWSFSGISLTELANGMQLSGDLGNAMLYIYYYESHSSNYVKIETTPGYLHDTALRIMSYVVGISHETHKNIFIFTPVDINNNEIRDKFFSFVPKGVSISTYGTGYVYFAYVYDKTQDSFQSVDSFANVAIKKYVGIPNNITTPALRMYHIGAYEKSSSYELHLDGVYLFNKLP